MKSKTIVIRGYHCDSYGHVNNARYLELLEEARWEALSSAISDGVFKTRNLLFIVVNISINYRAEVKPNDTVEIHTEIKEFGKKSITFYQRILNQSTQKMAVDADVKFVLVNEHTKKMVFIDDELKHVFEDLSNKQV
jgi:thioesterase III